MVTLAQLELLSFYLVNLFLLSLSHLHPPLPLSSLHVHLAVRLCFVRAADTADWTGQVFSVSSRPVSDVWAVGGTEMWKEGADSRRAGSSSSAFGRSLTDFLTSHRYIDSRCHLGGFSDVQGSGTWGWWSASIGCVSFRIILKPTAFWPGHFDDSVDTHFDNICASARY